MRAILHLVLLTALRDRLIAGLFLLLVLAAALSFFLGGTAVNEQLNMSVAFAAGIGRLILVLGLTIFSAFHIQSLFESREIEAILSRAISRPWFVVSYWLGLTILVVIVAGLFAAGIVYISRGTPAAFLWAATLMAECTIVLAVATFAGLTLERATPTTFFTLAFYALARLMGYFAAIRDAATDFNMVSTLIKKGLNVVLLFVPRLDLFAQTEWLVYGAYTLDIKFVALQTALFLALLFAVAVFDLLRKQF